jgi:pyruvate carboxylase subunit B
VCIDADGITVDGDPVLAQLGEVDGTPIHLVTLGRTLHRIAVQRRPGRGRYSLWTDGYRFEVEALDERRRAIQDLTARDDASRGPAPLVAPMPGLVVRVNVQPGDTVEPGQALVVIEAMKMENELRAGSGGTVSAVAVRAGMAVEKGTVLVEIA